MSGTPSARRRFSSLLFSSCFLAVPWPARKLPSKRESVSTACFNSGAPFLWKSKSPIRDARPKARSMCRSGRAAPPKAVRPIRSYYRREVFLAAQSRKTIQFTVDPDFISRPLTIIFPVPVVMPRARSICGAIFHRRRCCCWSTIGGSLPPIALGPTAQSRLVALSLSELPPIARALLGVSHLILYDQSLRDLSRPQLLALDTWISAGGRMVIIGSLNYASTRSR